MKQSNQNDLNAEPPPNLEYRIDRFKWGTCLFITLSINIWTGETSHATNVPALRHGVGTLELSDKRIGEVYLNKEPEREIPGALQSNSPNVGENTNPNAGRRRVFKRSIHSLDEFHNMT